MLRADMLWNSKQQFADKHTPSITQSLNNAACLNPTLCNNFSSSCWRQTQYVICLLSCMWYVTGIVCVVVHSCSLIPVTPSCECTHSCVFHIVRDLQKPQTSKRRPCIKCLPMWRQLLVSEFGRCRYGVPDKFSGVNSDGYKLHTQFQTYSLFGISKQHSVWLESEGN